jgi:hypothetical protein
VIALPGPANVSLVPVRRQGRIVGAYVLSDDTVRYRPVLDLQDVVSAVAAVGAVAASAAAVAVVRRRRPAVGRVTMGPGGWISFKNASAPALRPGRRPWWARVLRARRLVVEK